jgi:hypothetical protein
MRDKHVSKLVSKHPYPLFFKNQFLESIARNQFFIKT